MTVALLVNTGKEKAMSVARAAAEILGACRISCLAEKEAEAFWRAPLPEGMRLLPRREAILRCDIVVTVGGDGTILHAVRDVLDIPRPLLGINVGHLGFLAALEPEDISRLSLLAKGDYRLEPRRLLEARLRRTGEVFWAFNEFAFSCAGVVKQIGCTLQCDGTAVANYSGDGMLIATSTGSTAYSLSAGGPIVDAALDVLIATPICAHTLNAPPMVFSATRTLQIVVSGNRSENSYLVSDGQEKCLLREQDCIDVRLSEKTVSLIALDDIQQFRAVDSKLKKR